MMVAFANFGGPSGGLRSAVRSSIWSDAVELLVRLGEILLPIPPDESLETTRHHSDVGRMKQITFPRNQRSTVA